MLRKSFALCGCIIEQFAFKKNLSSEQKAETRKACWLIMLNKAGYSLKNFVSKL